MAFVTLPVFFVEIILFFIIDIHRSSPAEMTKFLPQRMYFPPEPLLPPEMQIWSFPTDAVAFCKFCGYPCTVYYFFVFEPFLQFFNFEMSTADHALQTQRKCTSIRTINVFNTNA